MKTGAPGSKHRFAFSSQTYSGIAAAGEPCGCSGSLALPLSAKIARTASEHVLLLGIVALATGRFDARVIIVGKTHSAPPEGTAAPSASPQ